MPELTFVFGPNNTFFFDSPKAWKFHNIPPTLRQLFGSAMSPSWRIAQPYCLALGPQNNSPEPIWYCGCKVLDGIDKIFYSQTYFDLNYPDLSRWTKMIPNAARSCFVTFGPGLSYFACSPGHGSTWAGVSSELTDKVQKAFDTPSCVALGAKGSWFVSWPDGYYSWKFYGCYSGLDKILNEAAPRTVSYVAISPYNKEQYFIAFTDRTVKYNFVGAPEWIPQIQGVFNEWQAELAQQRQALQRPYSAVPPHLSQYLPNPNQPAYVAAHYANAQPPAYPAVELPTCVAPSLAPLASPMASPAPAPNGLATSFAVELPGSVPVPPAPPPAASERPISMTSSKKRRAFFWSKKK